MTTSPLVSERVGQFFIGDDRLEYTAFGGGDRWVVLLHGQLMSRTMHDRLARVLAAAGMHVVTLDLLGHGRSDRPEDPKEYSMSAWAEQVVALLDHLGADQAVVGGTSLGANVSLELAVLAPDRVRGLLIEMPVLDNALLGAALAFTPVLLGLRFGRPLLTPLAAVLRRVPRSHYLVDIGLDWLRQDPAPSSAVLEGILFHRSAPPHSERVEISEPALVIGHPSDPLHPFSDAGMLVEEMPNGRLIDANSILEWRLNPGRLDDLLAEFLDEAYSVGPDTAAARTARRAA